MGIFDSIVSAVTKGLKKGATKRVEQKVYSAVAPKATEEMNRQAEEFNAASRNLEQAAAANAGVQGGPASVYGNTAELETLKNIKFCAVCKQPCDVNAATCPVCGETTFKSAMQLAEEEDE